MKGGPKIYRAFVGALLVLPVLAVLLVVVTQLSKSGAAALPVLGEVPEFSLVEASGEPLRRSDLEGRVWVASFIFTRCGGTCPIMTSRTRQMQKELASVGDVRLVSFSVDPEWDTPAVLREYADRYDAERKQWLFVTGDKEQIYQLARTGFKLGVDETDEEGVEPILHSSRLVLVDRQGGIRGYYDGTDVDAMGQLASDVKRLVGRGRR